MSTVHARVWRFTVEKGPAGPEAVQAVEIGQGPLPVSLAALANINALACDLRRTVDQRVRDHEISLLLSYLSGGAGPGPLGVDCGALDSSSGHIRRFVSECTGLGVMTAVSETLFDWKSGTDGLSSFDVLPDKLLGAYARTGVRPDLLYDLAAGPLAGEARGRRRNTKQMLPAGKGTADQRLRLQKLATWSAKHGGHDYFMSWVWLGTGGVYVDIFLPEDSPASAGLKTGWIEKPGSQQPWRFRVPRSDSRRRRETDSEDYIEQVVFQDVSEAEAPGTPVAGVSGTAPLRRMIQVPTGRSFSLEDLEADPLGAAARGGGTSADRARRVVEAAMDRAFGREEDPLGKLSGVPVRGTWLKTDAVGPARYEVLVGVLGERVPVDLRAQRHRLAAETGHRLDLFLEGRLLTLVHPVGEPRPSWGLITEEALG
ncbi:hypothetical protein OG455_10685 [Kitasatospora sp. NBC_01287]|uniref:hypothetical protein n=1 Tax=Kitasatospora sp. NBC_01287 TaxID=2903573 RepID=UPI00224CA234|nr:hypothetical protein [Kitasatospora sp. NBC_01287]MCX4745986.1 hypothetical protein [Kitasatospora sp. NBC_01287]